jgi:hypothetical protein
MSYVTSHAGEAEESTRITQRRVSRLIPSLKPLTLISVFVSAQNDFVHASLFDDYHEMV